MFVLFFASAFSSMTQHIEDLLWVKRLWGRFMEQPINSKVLRVYPSLISKGCLEGSSHLWVSLGPKTKASTPNSSACT